MTGRLPLPAGEEADRFPRPFPPPFASAWGDDRFGLWAEMFLPAEGSGETIVQRLRWVEPGTFLMGSPEDEPGREEREGPQHLVTLTEGYWLADSACTQALWEAVIGYNPSHFKGDPQRPVEQVSWREVQTFLRSLGDLLPGNVAVLPTEAQWEYACRAGTTTPFSFGDQISPEIVNYDGNHPYAGGAKGQPRGQTVPVKSLPPNAWGLYEMHGNVWEWCADEPRTYEADPQRDPVGRLDPTDQWAHRCVRGGTWNSNFRSVRAAWRIEFLPGFPVEFLGFRFCLNPIEPGPEPRSSGGGSGRQAVGAPGGRAAG